MRLLIGPRILLLPTIEWFCILRCCVTEKWKSKFVWFVAKRRLLEANRREEPNRTGCIEINSDPSRKNSLLFPTHTAVLLGNGRTRNTHSIVRRNEKQWKRSSRVERYPRVTVMVHLKLIRFCLSDRPTNRKKDVLRKSLYRLKKLCIFFGWMNTPGYIFRSFDTHSPLIEVGMNPSQRRGRVMQPFLWFKKVSVKFSLTDNCHYRLVSVASFHLMS